MKEIPAISVIVPLYNAEKYLGECLESLLAQTFQDFEVIAADDCSTDNSVKIIKSYAAKFGGRLKISKLKKNSGGASFPRNKGMENSRGEYIYFLDSDDTITPTALEELYTLAKNFDADVVQCEKFYSIPDKFWNAKENFKPTNYLTGEKFLITTPLIWENNFEERVDFFAQRKLIWNVVTQLIRRDFVMENEIRFCNTYAEDMIFTICELCCAEKFLVVPNTVYFYRRRANSSSTKDYASIQKLFHRQINALSCGIRYIDKFLSDSEIFFSRPDLKYILLDTFTQQILQYLDDIYAQIPAHALDELLRKEFGADSAFETFMFNLINAQRLQLMQMHYQLNQQR